MNAWLLVIITLILSAFFSGMEIAFVSSNRLKVEIDKNKGCISARIISYFLYKQSKFIGALLLGNNIALVVYGIVIVKILEPFIVNLLPENLNLEYLVLLIQTIISTIIILFFAEFIPKALFRIKPNSVLNIFALPLVFFYYLLYPVIYLFIGLAELILKIFFGIDFSEQKYVFSPIDLDEYVKEYSTDQENKEEVPEYKMFRNAIEFKNVRLRECMIPRTEIIALEENEPIHELRKKFIETGHSKILIFRESIDNVIGYTHSFDMFRKPSSIKQILKSIIIVPETMLASEVLKMMIQQHKSVAVVVDEFGGTSGMVSLEDIIEEIFGEIKDEYDIEEFTERKINDSEYIFSARLEIDYLNKEYNLYFPENEEYETLAGYIIHHYEDIPDVSTEIIIQSYMFTILKATENRIEQIHLKILNE